VNWAEDVTAEFDHRTPQIKPIRVANYPALNLLSLEDWLLSFAGQFFVGLHKFSPTYEFSPISLLLR